MAFLLLFATVLSSLSIPATSVYIYDSSWPRDKSHFVQTAQDFCTAVDDVTHEVFVGLRGPGLQKSGPVLVFNEEGDFLRFWGYKTIDMIHGMRLERLSNGTALLWVTDLGKSSVGHTVKLFSTDGRLVETIGTPGKAGTGTNPIQFDQVADVALDDHRNLYIVDGDGGMNNRLVKLTAQRSTAWVVGDKAGNQTGQFYIPHSVEVDIKLGVVWVADRGNNRTQAFDLDTGKFVTEWTCMKPFVPYHMRVDPTGSKYIILDLLHAAILTMQVPESREMISQCTVLSHSAMTQNQSKPHAFSVSHTSGSLYIGEVGSNVTQKYTVREAPPFFNLMDGPNLLPCTALSIIPIILLVLLFARWKLNRRKYNHKKNKFERMY